MASYDTSTCDILQSYVKQELYENVILCIEHGGGTVTIADKIGKITYIVHIKHTFHHNQ